jgi:hypothetical protein
MKGLIVACLAALLAAGVAAAFVLWPASTPISMLLAPATDPALVERGAHLARLGDCIAFRTSKGGKEMAGGLAFDTPMGRIYSTNITPDPATGIGRYTRAEFEGRCGVA